VTDSAPLSVLYVRDHLQAAGGSTYLLDTLPRFDPIRVKPVLYVLGPLEPDHHPAVLDQLDVTFTDRAPGDWRRPVDLWRLARRVRPDLVVLSGPRSMVQGGLLAALLGVPSLLHLNFVIEFSPAQVRLQRLLRRRGQHVIAVSEAVRRWAADALALDAAAIERIYPVRDWHRHGDPAHGARARLRHACAVPDGAIALLLVGRLLLAEKGQDVMLHALRALLRDRPDTVLLLAGDGPDRHRVVELAQALGVEHAVRLLGYRQDVPELLAACDLLVVPSTCEEAFGLVALEAHAAGRPVIVSAAGGLTEIVSHGVNGCVVPRGDAPALANAIRRLLADPALVRRLVERGRIDVERFGFDAHMTTLTDLFARVVARHGR